LFDVLGVIGFLEFVHRPVFQKLKKHDVSEIGAVSASGQGTETLNLLGPLEKANVIHWTIDDGNRSGFRNVVFSSF
jgi:hypothetical protein